MIAYLDASALVKLYVEEPGSAQVRALLGQSRAAGTGVLSRAEVVAALARAARVGLIPREAGLKAVGSFARDWERLVRIQFGETLGEAVTVATWDRELWRGARDAGLSPWPEAISG